MPRLDLECSSFSIQKEIIDLKTKLSEKESELIRRENNLLPYSGPASTSSNSSSSEAEEWHSKYERLVDAHKKLQRTNMSLEEKLLNIAEKIESEKSLVTRDLATQTQKVVEAKLTIQQLHKQNTQLKSDLRVALNILQMKPNSFISQKLETLPEDLQCRVRQVADERQEGRKHSRNGGQKITIAVPNGAFSSNNDDAVSAAILAKVLEEREKERKKEQKFCIDIGTQTHRWQFPDTMELLKQSNSRARKLLALREDYSLLEELSYLSGVKSSSQAGETRFLGHGRFLDDDSDCVTDEDEDEDDEIIGKDSWKGYPKTHVSNILLASLMQTSSYDATGNLVDNSMKGCHSPDCWDTGKLLYGNEYRKEIPKRKSPHSKVVEDRSSCNLETGSAVLNQRLGVSPKTEKSFNLLDLDFKLESGGGRAAEAEHHYETLSDYQAAGRASQHSSLSSILSLTQQAATPTSTAATTAFFHRSVSSTFSSLQTDM